MSPITPLIVCGGTGTRLWPVSRTHSPKQFQKVAGEDSKTFFQTAVERHRGPAFAEPLVVSSEKHAATVAGQLRSIGSDARVLLEPVGRNTGPAVLAAALDLYSRDPEAILLVVPADHVIEGDINTPIAAVAQAAAEGHIITFGIKPRYAETGFGYITDAGPIAAHPGLHKVERFVEKPPTRKARLLVESDIAYWASGISMMSAATIIDEYRRYDEATFRAVQQSLFRASATPLGTILDTAHFERAADLPTEQAVFEKTKRIALAPLDVEWSDVGSWTAMAAIQRPDEEGNVLQGDVMAVGTTGTMVRAAGRFVAVVGMQDVIVVDTPDALLITRRGADQDVKKVATALKGDQRPEAHRHVEVEHEWGLKRTLVETGEVRMDQLRILPGAQVELPEGSAQEAVVSNGSVEITDPLGRRPARPGDRLRIDGGAARVRNTGNDSAVVIVICASGFDAEGVTPPAADDVVRPLRA